MAAGKIFGSVRTPNDMTQPNGYLRLSPYLCPYTKTCDSIYMYNQTNGKNVRVGIYSDNAGVPLTLLAESAKTALSGPSWNLIPLTNTVNVIRNTFYWLGYVFVDAGSTTTQYNGGNVGVYYRAQGDSSLLTPLSGLSYATPYDGGLQAWGSFNYNYLHSRRDRLDMGGVSTQNQLA